MISELQRTARRQFIGSSDAPAICGLDPYRSPADVYLSKTQDLDDAGNDATEAGNLLEGAVLDWAADRLHEADAYHLSRDRMVTSGPLCANLDAVAARTNDDDLRAVVEAKTTGIVGPPDPGYGDITDGPDVELPERVIVQVHHQLAVCGPAYRLAFVPVLIGGRGFRMYTVSRNDELAEAVARAAREFMERHVAPRVPPSDFRPSLDVLKRIRREPNKTVDLDDGLVESWIVARASRLKAEGQEEAAQAALLGALGDAEAGRYGAGEVTYFQQRRKPYSVPESTYRVLRLKAAKG